MSVKIILLIMKTILLIMKTILLIVMLETGYAGSSCKSQSNFWPTKIHEIRGHIKTNQCQDKTNPSLVTGLECKLYTRNPFDYRRLCE